MPDEQPSLFDTSERIDLTLSSPRGFGKTHALRVAMCALTEPGLYFIPSRQLFISVEVRETTRIWRAKKKLGDKWKNVLRVRETGVLGIYDFWQVGASDLMREAYESIEFLFPHQMQCRSEYATETNRCTECDRELRNPRSVWYTIGPDCEKKRPEIIAQIDALHGGTWEEFDGIYGTNPEDLEKG